MPELDAAEGLENRMKQKVGLLSGGQRQALTLLMASLQQPKLLLLDEHTAALDPKTAATVLSITDRIIKENSQEQRYDYRREHFKQIRVESHGNNRLIYEVVNNREELHAKYHKPKVPHQWRCTDKISALICTFFGTGMLPKMPGSYGSLAAALVAREL